MDLLLPRLICCHKFPRVNPPRRRMSKAGFLDIDSLIAIMDEVDLRARDEGGVSAEETVLLTTYG